MSRDQAGLADFDRGSAILARYTGVAIFEDTAHKLLYDTDMRLQPDRRFRLAHVIEPLRRKQPFPLLTRTKVEELVILEVDDSLCTDHLEAHLTARQAGCRHLGRDPHLAHNPVLKRDLRHDALSGHSDVAKCAGLGEDLPRPYASEPE